ncbi:hypothetical protein [Allopontixanthobacter sediminis]|nr:hypothetical protein [Allopontixanthobacter sediminis]
MSKSGAGLPLSKRAVLSSSGGISKSLKPSSPVDPGPTSKVPGDTSYMRFCNVAWCWFDQRLIIVLKVDAVRPGAANPHLGWSQRLGKHPQALISLQVLRFSLTICVGSKPSVMRPDTIFEIFARLGVRIPEVAAGYLDGFDILGLETLVDAIDCWQF